MLVANRMPLNLSIVVFPTHMSSRHLHICFALLISQSNSLSIMRNFFSTVVLGLIVFSRVNGAAVKPAPEPDPNYYDVILNKTIGHGHDPDPRFELVSHYTTEKLPATAILMNTITMLTEAADLEFHEIIDFDKSVTSEDFPNVVIEFRMARARDKLPDCFCVWALYLAATDMIRYTKFFVSEHDLIWKGKVVARLHYQKPNPNGLSEDGREVAIYKPNTTATSYLEGDLPTFDVRMPLWPIPINDTSDPNLDWPTTGDLSPDLPSSEIVLHLQYLEDARDMPIWTVFQMVISTLKDNAEYPALDRVQSFVVNVPGYDAKLGITTNGGPPRRRLIPAFVLGQRRVAEIKFSFEVDGHV